jgi:hypothetical protein
VVDLVPFYDLRATRVLVVLDQVVQHLVAIAEFIDHELLHCYDVNHVEQGFETIEREYAQLVGNTTVAVFLQHIEHGVANLSSLLGVYIFAQLYFGHLVLVRVWFSF